MSDNWHLKQVRFQGRPVKIITQNLNGPCSFIAICNILILRGKIEILPHDRPSVSYHFLSQLVAEYLLTNCPDVDISAALSIMPTTTKGLDLNPQFTSVTAFSPASDAGELDLFAQAGIQLVHGWLVDPDSPEAEVMAHIRDYDTAVTLIADADYITKGQLLDPDAYQDQDHAGPSTAGASSAPYSDQQQHTIERAITAQRFLDATKSQLTYHGLFQLASTLEPGSLVALFRNAHLSVVYKPASAEPTVPSREGLYALVTDDVFLNEPSIVWERLEDVDGNWSTFVDADFHRAIPVGGDVAGQTAEGVMGIENAVDHALARQLQNEEDERARAHHARQLAREQGRIAEAHVQAQAEFAAEDGPDENAERRQRWRAQLERVKGKRGKGCLIM